MKVVAILVTYHPDLTALATHLEALAPQVDGLVLVDNGSGQTPALQAVLAALPVPHKACFQPENRGLGQAQNAGVAQARTLGAEAVLLMDQDSHPGPGMVAALQAGLAARADDQPAAIGANFTEPARGTSAGLPPGAIPEMPALIASGTLIPCSVLESVGPFDEALFVDFVDTEWSFRARAQGYRLFAARGAPMTHRIGDETVQVFGRTRPIHAPARAYYQTRNLLRLWRARHMPRRWLLGKLTATLARRLGLALIVPPRGARFKAVARGLWHGLRNRGGTMP